MKILKKWWFWLIVVLFVLVNLWITDNVKSPNPNQPQLNDGNIGTH